MTLRRRLQLMSFRDRLVLLAAAAVAAAIVLASGIVYLVVKSELRDEVDTQLRGLVAGISPPRQISVPTGESLLILPSEPLGGNTGYAQIVRLDGTVIRPRNFRLNV